MYKRLVRLLHRHIRLVFLLALLMSTLSIYLWRNVMVSNTTQPLQQQSSIYSQEIVAIKETKNTMRQASLYKKLIERVGPIEAQEQLLRSGLPFGGDTHLLNHEVGEWLYDTYKEKGIIYCKDYFLSSCYHGFLIPVIADGGFKNLKHVMDLCIQAGKTTAVQCAHGIGHGLLAWEDYASLPKALADCDSVAALSSEFTVYNCYDGVFMENNWAVHNGVPSPDRWVKSDDPTYPCYDSQIDEKYRKACWSNQPQVMYKLFNGDIDKIVVECQNIRAIEYQDTCFDSIARQINPLTGGNVLKVFSLCEMMPVGWKSKCVQSNVSAFYSLGDRRTPFVLCDMIPPTGKAGCYEILQQRINSYTNNFSEKIALCSQIPSQYLLPYCPKKITAQ